MNQSRTVPALEASWTISGGKRGRMTMTSSVQTAMSGTAGVYSRRILAVIQSLERCSPVPTRRSALALAYPPTKKKIGITWTNHVTHAEKGSSCTAFINSTSPVLWTQMPAASQ